MKTIKILIIAIMIITGVDSAEGFTPPAGCVAETWIAYQKQGLTVISVDFYRGNSLVCSNTIQSNGVDAVYGTIGVVAAGAVTETGFNDLMIKLMYLFVGVALAGTFLVGIHIVNT